MQLAVTARHAAQVLIEAGVFDGDGGLGRQSQKGGNVLGVEGAGEGTFNIEDADDPIAGNERHGQFAAGAKNPCQVIGLAGDIGDQHRFATGRHPAHDTAAYRDLT